MSIFKFVISLVVLIFPWSIRRILLNFLFNYKIHQKARIGFSIIIPDRLEMAAGSYIGHLNICKGLSLLSMGEESIINNLNWISGMPIGGDFFKHKADRNPALILGEHAAITNRHLIDCSDEITVGCFTIIAGFRSQLMTHSVNLDESRQDCAPIRIGDFCFIGTNSVLLPGSSLGNYSVLGASSVLNKEFDEEYYLYAGVPATKVKQLSDQMEYFNRTKGFIW
jgi:acetyltransferase-like isoleucine patch superfamily enzyme